VFREGIVAISIGSLSVKSFPPKTNEEAVTETKLPDPVSQGAIRPDPQARMLQNE
jgi:hypothetical protein